MRTRSSRRRSSLRAALLRFRRPRFADLVERQLDLFEREHAGLIRDCELALRAYHDAPAEEAEERYGDFLDVVDTAHDELIAMRDEYVRTLTAETAEEYVAAFNELARRRLPRFTLELD